VSAKTLPFQRHRSSLPGRILSSVRVHIPLQTAGKLELSVDPEFVVALDLQAVV
jgi:hypothetical protein